MLLIPECIRGGNCEWIDWEKPYKQPVTASNAVWKRNLELRALVLLIVLSISIASFHSISAAQAASSAQIKTEGGTWTGPTITILIIPQLSAPWFKPSYTYDVNHAVSRWSQSITAYTDVYGSNYLRSLSFVTCVSGINDTSCGTPDIQIRFIESFGAQSSGLGVTNIRVTNSAIFQAPVTTTLAAYDPSNATQLTDTDMINIASHEFGHALGLGHASVSATDDGTFELMFLSYGQAVGSPRNSLEAPSTLDLYALSYVYDWLVSSSMLNGPGHPLTDISLPSGVAYSSIYPYGEQILALQNSISQLKLEIIILVIVAALLLALVLALVILLSRKKPVQPQSYVWQSAGPPTPAPPGSG
jgi:matrixin